MDSDEEMEYEEEREKESFQKEDVFVLKRDIASGSFNCAHQIDGPNGPEVIRIAYLPGFTLTSKVDGKTFHLRGYEQIERQNRRIIRGLEIVHLLNHPVKPFDRILGPSLLKQLSPYRVFDEKYEKQHFDGPLCGKLRITQQKHHTLMRDKKKGQDMEENNRFALQHIEFINGGIFDYSSMKKAKVWEKEFVAFSLVWFFTMASQLFGFRHRDLKADNIMLRITKDTQWFTFNLNNEYFFHLKSRVVPVVIDYDFASVQQTESVEDRYARANPGYRPFEANLFMLYKLYGTKAPLELYQRDISPDFYQNETTDTLEPWEIHQSGYDWWALGISLLHMYTKDAENLFEAEADMYAKFMSNRWPAVAKEKSSIVYLYFNRVFYSACIASLFAQSGFIIRPPSTLYPEIGALFFPPTAPNINMESNIQFNKMYSSVGTSLLTKDRVSILLSKLLNWNPFERNKLDHILIFQELATKAPYKDLEYQFESPLRLNMIDLRDYPGYQNLRTCVSCLISSKNTPLYECECCKEIFCGEECQRIKH